MGSLKRSCGAGSVVGIETGYELDSLGIESREAWFSAPVQTGPGAHPASCTMGTGSFPWIKSGRGVTLTPHPLLVPWSRKGRAIPLLPLGAVRPVQSLSACTRVHFTFYQVQLFPSSVVILSVATLYVVTVICLLCTLKVRYHVHYRPPSFCPDPVNQSTI